MIFNEIRDINQLALDTISLKETNGIPTSLVHIVQHEYIEKLAGVERGDYLKNPDEVYIQMEKNIGVNVLDQYLARNPLSIGDHGYEDYTMGATTGAKEITRDGLVINSPEAVVEHLEKFEFPRLQKRMKDFNRVKTKKNIIEKETLIQQKIGLNILKTGYEFINFPKFRYYDYGYENYFMAYALYPEIMAKDFKLQADYCLVNNMAALDAYNEAGLPPLYRLDHDIADSRGTLVNIKSLDQIWLPEVERCLNPVIKSKIRLIWHCDGNLMEMIPRLIDIGIKGFQGFQYEDGMDYKKICQMKTKEGENLIIWAGVSVTQTLPNGKPLDIKKEMEYLVQNGPKTGLFLSASSTVMPGTPWENIKTMIEGFEYYRSFARG